MNKRRTIIDIQSMKGKEPIAVLTAYSAPMAALLDAYVDILLVGDSLGMVLYGYESTLPVSLEQMAQHSLTVSQASHRACIIADMPFGSYQESPSQALHQAAKLMKYSGCNGIKLEGGIEMADTVAFLTRRGIPVMAHIGVKPQSVHQQGGYRYQGRTQEESRILLEEARAFEQAGAFALLLECVNHPVAKEITQSISIPTIGIGASNACDGQVLVTEDMLGLFEQTPRFVKQYADMRRLIDSAVGEYVKDVKEGAFPSSNHSYDYPLDS